MDVTATHDYLIKLNDRELKLALKGLALVAGLKMPVTDEERAAADVMNKQLLKIRAATLADQLRVAQCAVDRALGVVLNPEEEDER